MLELWSGGLGAPFYMNLRSLWRVLDSPWTSLWHHVWRSVFEWILRRARSWGNSSRQGKSLHLGCTINQSGSLLDTIIQHWMDNSRTPGTILTILIGIMTILTDWLKIATPASQPGGPRGAGGYIYVYIHILVLTRAYLCTSEVEQNKLK